MKKIVLLTLLSLFSIGSFGQIICPTDVKRNNSNNCTTDGTGGQIELIFDSEPNSNLQIDQIYTLVGEGTILTASKSVQFKNGKWSISWCFDKENLGPIKSINEINFLFYIDSNKNGSLDNEELTYASPCSHILPIKIKSFKFIRKS